MAKCKRCGRSGFFLNVNSSSFCSLCAETIAYEKFKEKDWANYLEEKDTEKQKHESEIQKLKDMKKVLIEGLKEPTLAYDKIFQKAKADALSESTQAIEKLEKQKTTLIQDIMDLKTTLSNTQENLEKKEKQLRTSSNRLLKIKEVTKSLMYANSREAYISNQNDRKMIEDVESFLSPTVEIKLQAMNVRQLRSEFRKNQKLIKELLLKYKSRYTTKSNMAIYSLMVIALESELQNALYNIKYGKLETSIRLIKEITEKYQKIASDGNQTIEPTVRNFIGEIEYYFIRAIEIEYEYYVQKERIKEEQRAIREQMRQEALEKKELEKQRKHLEKEEEKYYAEIEALQTQLNSEHDADKKEQFKARIDTLKEQLSHIHDTKEEILKLENGKAGSVYIISNFGSFGESVFKIGMTRRLDPMDRIRELSSASVPFPYDVHSFIFSDNAVALEASLHKRLNEKRVNKVNMRKEFFSIKLDELEDLVYEIEPTAEFTKTMIAEQFNQSLSIVEIPDHAGWPVYQDEFDDPEYLDEEA